eukprot:Sspe_Gene.37401::Locus_18053_Transcript_1_2_Confidence_0.667_Length_1646::g.37401::m.37401/K00948/PRPS, prsA; ribose-phosphate pyrophosphokinase
MYVCQVAFRGPAAEGLREKMSRANSPVTPTVEDEQRFCESTYYSKGKKHLAEDKYRLRVIPGRSNPTLAEDICKVLRLDPANCTIEQGSNEEIKIKASGIQGDDVYIIQPMCSTEEGIEINTSLMELLMAIHALKLQAARRIVAICPYFAYARQDRKTRPRVPISASAVSQLMMSMGVDRVLTVDLHCGQIQGFFHNTPVDNLPMHSEWARYVNKHICPAEGVKDQSSELTIVSPDAGGVERAMHVANATQARAVVTILRRRDLATESDKYDLVGDVEGQVCVIIDDIIDTGRTLLTAVDLVVECKAKAVYACITHGVLTSPACENITKCEGLKELIITDSIPNKKKKAMCPKLKVLPLAPMLAEAIERTHTEYSLSAIFH